MKDEAIEELKNCSILLMEAWKQKDSPTLNKLIDDDALFISEIIGNYHFKKNDYVHAMINRFPLKNYKIEFLNFSSANTAQAVVQIKLYLPALGGIDVESVYLVTDIWIRKSNDWKLFVRQPVNLK